MDNLLCEVKSDKTQIIFGSHHDGHPNHAECSSEIFSRDVVIRCRDGAQNHGSSKVKLINRIDYNWELRFNLGQLVAAHPNKDVIAYAMKGKDGGMVRVINQVTNQRALIKNLKNDVRDVAFAFIKNEIMLSCVDDEGNIMVFEIFDKPDEIKYNLILNVYHASLHHATPTNFKLVWCPYLPSQDEDVETADDAAKMFVFLNGTTAEVWDVAEANAKYGTRPVSVNEDKGDNECSVEIDHEMELIDAAYSSDGTAIATACSNGYVYFYQIYMVGTSKHKLLHEWKPHDGKPLSCLIFVDNILEYSSDSRFWKFALTGAKHNIEIKLWSCENWTCLQTIHFQPNPKSVLPSVFLRIRIDYRGQHVLMSEINNRVLYVLKLERNDSEKLMVVTSISEFLLPAPFLSFHIIDASEKKIPALGSDEELYNEDQDDFDDDGNITATVIKMLVIQPKKFQECDIVFQPENMLCSSSSSCTTAIASATANTTTTAVKTAKDICDKDVEEAVDSIPKLEDLQTSITKLIQQQQQQGQLITPEAFETATAFADTPETNGGVLKKGGGEEEEVANLIDFQHPQKEQQFASGGSSPSREVQEILSLNNSFSNAQEFFDSITNPSSNLEEAQKPYHGQVEKMASYEDKVTSDAAVVWPKIPVVKDNEIVKSSSDDLQNYGGDVTTHNELSMLNLRLNNVEGAIRKQAQLLEQLVADVGKLTQCSARSAAHQDPVQDLLKGIEVAMSKQCLQIAKLTETLAMHSASGDKQQDQLFSAVSQLAVKTVSDKVQAAVAQEMKACLGPPLRQMLDTLKHQLETQHAQRLQAQDVAFKESTNKFLNSKAVTDALAASVVSVIAPSLEKCYRDMIANSMIPTWEKVCTNMFQQINSTFTQGTKEYTVSVESYMERQRKVQERGKDLIAQMQTVSESMKVNSERLSNTLSTELGKQFNAAFKTMQDKLMTSIRDVVTEQVKQGFKNQASVIEDSVINAVRSRAVTPSPHTAADSQAEVNQLLAKGNHSKAFEVALTAENLALVIYVCEKVDVQSFFAKEEPLPQSCLLALMQQLSVELFKHTDLKLSYIRAAFLALSPENPTTKQYMPKILRDLLKQLQVFMASNPSSKHLTEARLLKMAVESQLK